VAMGGSIGIESDLGSVTAITVRVPAELSDEGE
jgi:chemotaxis protein histidine kinase CheA